MIEILIATGIFSLVVLVAGKFARDVVFLGSMSQNKFNTEQDSRKILRPMIAEVRSASPSSLGSYPIEQAATSTFVFYSDIDDDGLKEKIRYFLSNKKLQRGQIKPAGTPLVYNSASEQVYTLVNDVISTSTPIFSYYDANYTGTTSPLSLPVSISAIRLLKITITVDKNPNVLPGPTTVVGQVSIRNLKDNL